MGLTDWFQGWLAWWRGERTRGITRIAGDAPNDQVSEIVRLHEPPKPGHLRAFDRDPRLLPKQRLTFNRKPPKVMDRDEADRLFAGTLRTTNRAIRDVLPNAEQLARYGLPAWRSEQDVATALGLTVGVLRWLSVHRERETQPHYVTFSIPKRSGGVRLITAPKKRMKAVQRRLLTELVGRLPVADAAHGFRAGRSVKTNAEPHVGRAIVLHLDLEDFFHTVTSPRVRGYLIALGYGYTVAAVLAVLMTEAERQPVEVGDRVFHVPVGPRRCVQGAPTSPGLCNAITRKLDRRLAGLARKLGWTYTRYADDLAFSSDDPSTLNAMREGARRIIEAEGFRVNTKKTRVLRKGDAQRITGVTVNRVLGLSRQERRKLRAMIHQHGEDPAFQAQIDGHLAYLHMLNPAQAARLKPS